jgi:hypothetical protein
MDSILGGVTLPKPRFRAAPLPSNLNSVNGFKELQTYFPTLDTISSEQPCKEIWFDSKYRVSGLDISGISGLCTVHLSENEDCSGELPIVKSAPAFLKVTHLLDPIRWMKGQYSLPSSQPLPGSERTLANARNKLQDPMNQGYIETIASYALSRLREGGISPHFNQFFGAFCAKAATYRYNMTEEFQSFRNARWFWKGKGQSLYKLCVAYVKNPSAPIPSETLDELLAEPDDLISDSEGDSDSSIEEVEVAEGEEEATSVHSGGLSEIDFAEDKSKSESESTDSFESCSSDIGDIYNIYAEMNDFPVMILALENNSGTMDSLLDDYYAVGAAPGTDLWEAKWSAWVFQVVAALCVAQKFIGFTHNDLHTNNIVWIETAEEYMYYIRDGGEVFRVPTYGKLFRIIDFGRAIYRLNGQLFFSDDFKVGNDAEGQYAFKPLVTNPDPEVGPNPSFDLCRLAVSLFDALFPKPPPLKEGGVTLSSEEGLDVQETACELYNILWTWMLDDEGRNVLVEATGEERFPDFDLYRHIAESVHGAVPSRQLTHPVFDRFQVNPSEVGDAVHKWKLFC